MFVNPLNAELNPICHLLELLGVHHIFHVSELRVKVTKESVFRILCPELSLSYTLQHRLSWYFSPVVIF
jgi:hypothetical protein